MVAEKAVVAARPSYSWLALLRPVPVVLAILVGTCPITTTAAPALPGEPCQVDSPENLLKPWTTTERWVWRQVCTGEIADLNKRFGRILVPREEAECWTDEGRKLRCRTERRRLSPAFLETILLHDPWRSALPRRRVRIVGAMFDETIDVDEAELPGELSLDQSRFTASVSLRRIRAPSLISFDGSALTETLNMASATIGGPLSMSDGAEFAEVVLSGAEVKGSLSLIGAKVTGTLNMDVATIGGPLFLRDGAEVAEVVLRGADIGGQLDMSGAKVTGTLNMNPATIGAVCS
jgi:hypothetical protein